MAEQNYFITSTDSGSVNIGEDVFLRLVEATVSEMDAVAGLATSYGPELAQQLGRKSMPKGVALTTNEDGGIILDVVLLVRYGFNVAQTAEAVQDHIRAATEALTGIACQVNVHVSGISFEKVETK